MDLLILDRRGVCSICIGEPTSVYSILSATNFNYICVYVWGQIARVVFMRVALGDYPPVH